MRILHLLGDRKLPKHPDSEAASGLVHAALEIARAQVSLGHDVVVAVVRTDAWTSDWNGVRLISLAAAPWARWRVAGRQLDFRRHLPYVLFTNRHSFDVVQGHAYPYLRFLAATRRIVHFHSDPLYGGTTNGAEDLRSSDFARITKDSDIQVAVSNFVASQVERAMASAVNVHVVHNGVDTVLLDPERSAAARRCLREAWGVKPDDAVFLFSGAIVPDKGVIHLARAFAQVATHLPSVYLIFAGTTALWGGLGDSRGSDRRYVDDVRELIRVPLQAGQVIFLGNVAYADMPATYAASDVVVLPSIVREGCPLAVLEAMAAERPVIASALGGIPELLNDETGILISPGDSEKLAAAMSMLASAPDVRRRLGWGARQRASDFSWDVTAGKLDVIYHKIGVPRKENRT